jgi:hypothetical protein
MRSALGALEPGSDAYAGNATAYFFLHWWSHDFANALRIAQNSSDDAWSDTSNIALPRLLFVAWAKQAVKDPEAAQTYAAVHKMVTAAAEQDPRGSPRPWFAAAGSVTRMKQFARHAALPNCCRRAGMPSAARRCWFTWRDLRPRRQLRPRSTYSRRAPLFSGNSVSPALLKLDPVWEPIRNDPRFAQLVVQFEQPVDIKPAP